MITLCPLNFTDPMSCPGGRGVWCSACAPRGMLEELRGEAVTQTTSISPTASKFEIPLNGDTRRTVAVALDMIGQLR